MVFTEEHKELVKGETNSCSVVAALIATVAFAAAITVPGGSVVPTVTPDFQFSQVKRPSLFSLDRMNSLCSHPQPPF